MKKNIIYPVLIIFALTMISCNTASRTGQISINKLENDIVPFSSLPNEIKEFLYTLNNVRTRAELFEIYKTSEHVPLTQRHGFEPRLFIFNTTYEFEHKTVPLRVWYGNRYILLTDRTNDIIYRIDMGTPGPFFIYNNRELFIPTTFGGVLATNVDRFDTLTFNRYLLDSEPRRSNIRR